MIQTVPVWWQTYVNGRGFPGRSEVLDHVFASDPPSTFDARFLGLLPDESVAPLDRLVWRRGFFEASYLALMGKADWIGISPSVRGLAGRVLRSAKDWGIPLYVCQAWPDDASFCSGDTLAFRHCRYHGMLADDEWQIVSQLVMHHAPSLDLELLPVPVELGLGVFRFDARCDYEPGEPVRLGLNALVSAGSS